jgi:hypothetical protein
LQGPLRFLRTYLPGPLRLLRTYLPGPFWQKTTYLQESFDKELLICSVLEGKHCGLGSMIILNTNPSKFFHYVLLTINTYDVFIVALVFLAIRYDTLTLLME